MENASKALLIAGGVLIAIIMISLLIISYNNLSDYYEEDIKSTKVEQINKFNNEYTGYIRDKVKGSEILSLANKVVDYNDRKADPLDELYEPMCLIIDGIDPKDFLLDLSDYKYMSNSLKTKLEQQKIILGIYTNVGSNGKYDSGKDNYNILTDAISGIKEDHYDGITDKKIPVLSQNVYNILDIYCYKSGTDAFDVAVEKRKEILKDIFGKEDYSDAEIEQIEIAAYKAYQITQFKRAKFKCIEKDTKYNPNTSRIVSLHFKFDGGI